VAHQDLEGAPLLVGSRQAGELREVLHDPPRYFERDGLEHAPFQRGVAPSRDLRRPTHAAASLPDRVGVARYTSTRRALAPVALRYGAHLIARTS
jgi:hypothetical protein